MNEKSVTPTFATAHSPNSVTHLLILVDGSVLSAAEKVIKLWSRVDVYDDDGGDESGGGGKYLRSFVEGINSPIRMITEMPNGMFFSVSFNGLFIVWDLATGRQLYKELENHLCSAVLLKDPRLQDYPWLCGTNNGVLQRCKFIRKSESTEPPLNPFLRNLLKEEEALKEKYEWRWERTYYKHDGVNSTSIHDANLSCLLELTSDDGEGYDRTFVSGSWDQRVKVSSFTTNKLIHVFRGHTNFVKALLRVPNRGIIASSSDDGTVRLWSLLSGQCLHVLMVEPPAAKERVLRLLLLNNDNQDNDESQVMVTLSSKERSIRFWDTTNWNCLNDRTLTTSDTTYTLQAWKSSDDQDGFIWFVAGLANGSIQVIRTASKPNKLSHHIPFFLSKVTLINFLD